jgi:diguanylate cyclase (GGDEF)-like protein/PAS domain S-box-containing protein
MVELLSTISVPMIAAMGGGLLATFAGAWALGRRLSARSTALEADRIKQLADAALEGIVICEGDLVIASNTGFARLVGVEPDSLTGKRFSDYLSNPHIIDQLDPRSNARTECGIMGTDGARISVEVIVREMVFMGRNRFVYTVRDLRERKEAEARISYLAHHDSLTGLSNRVVFHEQLRERVERAHLHGAHFAVLSLDLDRFKQVNDVFGHAAGDDLLREVADRLRAEAGPHDVIARLGGDEFAVLHPSLDPDNTAKALAERLISALRKPIDLNGTSAITGLSIGIVCCLKDGEDVETLLANADVALYRAKEEGRCTYRLFEPQMDRRVRQRRALGQDLLVALQNSQIVLRYQPMTELSRGQVVGFEALMRWEHPVLGEISPSTFIPLAEEVGAILPLGSWVLHEACREAASWSNKLRISINLSVAQFLHGDLPGLVREALAASGLEASRLELEIKESVLISAPERAAEVLQELKTLGASIAIDDFGTGYSSLASLQTFPVDRIKIDRSFIGALGESSKAETLVRAMTNLGVDFNVPVIAEGVETWSQLEFVASEACCEAQGHIFGAPMPIAAFAHLTGTASNDPTPPSGTRSQSVVLQVVQGSKKSRQHNRKPDWYLRSLSNLSN